MTAVHVLATPDEEREADAEGGAPIELTVAFTDLEDFTTYTEVEGDDVIGHVVNLAARVTGSAEGGELVVTDHVRTAVGDLRGVAFDGPYTRSFKGIEEKVPVYLASRHVCRLADPQTDPAGRRFLDGGCK